MSSRTLDRRTFLSRAAGLGAASLAAPSLLGSRPARAGTSVSPEDRKFLFIFCDGGWDTTVLFTPEFDNANVDMEADAEPVTVGDLTYVAHAERPSVNTFMDTYGDQTAFVNGLEVRSIAHERCRLIVLTGGSSTEADDFPSTIAALSPTPLELPHLVIYGRAFTSEYTSSVVRVGSNGQFPALLDARALSDAGIPIDRITTDGDALADAYVQQRLLDAQAASRDPRTAGFAAGYARALDILDGVYARSSELDLDPESGGCARNTAADCKAALDCFELGLTRCAMVQFDGWCSMGFDTHSQNFKQSEHFELLFDALNGVMADLETRTSHTGRPLAEEVTVVLLSEMGRTPQQNSGGGRDHWTFTSAMFLGSGIRGGRVVGAMDSDFRGQPVDLASGDVTDSGVGLLPGHIGATLYALAGLDPDALLTRGEQPISAILDA
ncbi:MAG: DUF1501 domain-containing protein [Alphaproteobacteria bacterium]|nr:DUF1501 domain-containing protein [Alphaproteobacteria bacterium]